MTVSEEDRDRAALVIGQHYIDMEKVDRAQDADRCTCGPLVEDWDRHYIDALVAHGWGPRPTVSRELIAERLGPGMALNDDLVLLMRELGIEVTD